MSWRWMLLVLGAVSAARPSGAQLRRTDSARAVTRFDSARLQGCVSEEIGGGARCPRDDATAADSAVYIVVEWSTTWRAALNACDPGRGSLAERGSPHDDHLYIVRPIAGDPATVAERVVVVVRDKESLTTQHLETLHRLQGEREQIPHAELSGPSGK